MSATLEIKEHVNPQNGMVVRSNPVLAKANAKGMVYDESAKQFRFVGAGAPDYEKQKAADLRQADERARAHAEATRPNLRTLGELDLEALRVRPPDAWHRVPAALELYATSSGLPNGDRLFAWKRAPGVVTEAGWKLGDMATMLAANFVIPAAAVAVAAIGLPHVETFSLILDLHKQHGTHDRGAIAETRFSEEGLEAAQSLVEAWAPVVFVAKNDRPKLGREWLQPHLLRLTVRGYLIPPSRAVEIWGAALERVRAEGPDAFTTKPRARKAIDMSTPYNPMLQFTKDTRAGKFGTERVPVELPAYVVPHEFLVWAREGAAGGDACPVSPGSMLTKKSNAASKVKS